LKHREPFESVKKSSCCFNPNQRTYWSMRRSLPVVRENDDDLEVERAAWVST